ncbi:hypothetical protein LGM71_07860 [Burkholderia sp. AU33545]|uniref:DUF6708 domain-containing protein n=1 Tax=Burkholderia sp. AU33545 TaxID=2879631 RepID=UPI001CF42BEE|nr:DUF6708 domain-containing protein [Burkholderia sp. AU33545]MCA8200958.1 hypothetical protein [Burkholderia sp. AU33545]
MIRPKLNPPTRGWQADLPEPNAVPNEEPVLDGYVPNHLGDVYLELPRSYLRVQGVLMWLGFGSALFSVFIFSNLTLVDVESFLISGAFFVVCIWCVMLMLRLDISPPRDLPLRFNRLRRKMYVYEIDVVWWNPFIRWPIRAVAYDWDDVRAEAWLQQGAINGGHVMKWGVVLSVVKPGTNEVTDRFQLGAKGDGEATWAYICTYMQEGPGSLPPPDYPSRDDEDERTLNIAYLLAPKVKWPVEMDIESRTAPTDSACRASIVGGA